MEFTLFDWIILGVYICFLFVLAVYFSRRQKSANDYFLAGKNSRWYAVGTSIFAANISSEHLIGLAGSGAAAGLAVGAYEWMAIFCIFGLIWLFLPSYLKSKVYTMPEFLEHRYNPQCRWYLASVSILAYIFTKISVALFAGAIILKLVLGWDYLFSALILVIFTGLYTIAGGLSAVIFADIIQTIILILGSCILTLLGLHEAGGFAGLRQALPSNFFDMFRSVNDPVYPWPGVVFGIFILGIWYWATDQYVVQKVLSAKNMNHARAGGNLTALLKILPVFIFVLPGLIARVLWPVQIKADPDMAYPLMLIHLLPSGLSGLLIAALLAALVSSLSAVFTSCSSIFTMDIYRKIKPGANDKILVAVGRIFTGFVIIIGILWIPFIRHMSDQIYQYLQAVQAYISPPITAVFLVGILWKGATGRAALITLVSGGLLGVFKFILDLLPRMYESNILHPIVSVPFLYFSIIEFLICVVIIVGISLLIPEPVTKNAQNLVLVIKKYKRSFSKWDFINVIFSILIMIIVLSLWYNFS